MRIFRVSYEKKDIKGNFQIETLCIIIMPSILYCLTTQYRTLSRYFHWLPARFSYFSKLMFSKILQIFIILRTQLFHAKFFVATDVLLYCYEILI